MELRAFLSALVALVGLVLILMGPNPPSPPWTKRLIIGVIMFFCGLLVFLYMISSHTMDIKIG